MGRNFQGMSRRRMPRAQREAMLQRILVIVTAVVAVVVVVLVVLALVTDLIIAPREVVATVNGEEITAFELRDQVQLQLLLQGGQLPQTGGQDPLLEFSRGVLDEMINTKLIEQEAERRGITVTDEDVLEAIQLEFGFDAGEPEPTPTPFPTQIGADLTPTPTATFVFTPTPTLTPTPDPAVTPTATPEFTPTPTPDVTATPAPTATPLTEEEFEEAFVNYQEQISALIGLSEERAEELVFELARADLLRVRLFEEAEFDVSTENDFVNVSVIQAFEEEEIEEIYEMLEEGEEPFSVIAAENSVDPSSAPRGGNIGWQTRENLEFRYGEEFADVVFEELEEGEYSEPFMLTESWYIVQLLGRDIVPADSFAIDQRRFGEFNALIEELRAEADIVIEEDWIDILSEAF